ncbi:MAG TPA: hypothetical protein PLM07_18590 [Candidatus Rifleibacterium sp.]|nr:hypothetical protein [Candidatus Rifleibacterium sp.]HPT47892.1 hypothetical protein [Candidatus Rifleibacterium sp.]
MNIISNHSGKIKTRVFALLLLMLSCGLLISSFRSLGREFSGTMIRKTSTPGITSTQYHLFLLPASDSMSSEEILAALHNPDQPLQRVGVSALTFNEAQELEFISKENYSFMINIGGSRFLDLGLFWMLMGVAGVCGAFWMYMQTKKPAPESEKYQPEELDIPGLD